MSGAASDLDHARLARSPNGFSLRLNSAPDAASVARRLIASDDRLPVSAREDLLLVVTELVTNAVRHARVRAGQSLRVELRSSRDRVRVEVLDAGTGFAQARESPSTDDLQGWGLVLVDRIADRWGVDQAPSGTRAWCEIGLEP